MKVLVACEFSGVVRNAFRSRGHDAFSCDLLQAESEFHIQGDVLDQLDKGWDMMIAHPPCTYLSNSGVCHLSKDNTRWKDMIDAAVFFRKLLNAPIEKIAIENPVMHGYAKKIIGVTQTQVVQPWMFGHTEKKATCLWLKNLVKLEPTDDVKQEMEMLPKNQQQRLHYLPPSADRWKLRSVTYKGIAQAMCEQWDN